MVHDMVTNFIEQPISIILAVVSAKTDISTQEIQEVVKLVRNADFVGKRTVGVITKPDTDARSPNQRSPRKRLRDMQNFVDEVASLPGEIESILSEHGDGADEMDHRS
ncbi:uncharacterized protein BCR38DRAFT_482338 [Pseudomassariella vexata]|uniref:Dynamin N-terminal domain-containing protein n=1 Tax=Pseudomassariella vexata TaxID=1141098 RepID=A0A1Y2EBC8_9PEZI|nr:uncharacterized protein BCR38DRAFT_482338 [Pseudomassariella vexata]ORY68868.1 hypothetical protein BCR38DRAFT_482338 [Pseudomassariella vexata]